MTWQGHPRTTTPRWRKTRAYVLERDNHTCWICGQPNANRVDHKQALAEGGTDELTNLAPICPPCDRAKSSAEGHRARWAHKATRKPEKHPGLT